MALDDDFFGGKRPWSKLKDKIVGSYLPPYFAKVKHLNKRIICVDSFAGPGKFDDGTIGSPLIICDIAKSQLKDRYLAIFVNKKRDHHQQWSENLHEYITNGTALPIMGSANDLLKRLSPILTDETLLVYLDQFGLKGFEFQTLIPYLARDKRYSTELIINVAVPIIHRLSAKNAIKRDGMTEQVKQWHTRLSNSLGGDFWKKYLLNDESGNTPKEQIRNLMEDYKTQLLNYLPYVGYCPVYEFTTKSTVKYYIFFASRHPDAAILMNDIMFDAFWKYVWSNVTQGTLFENESIISALPSNYYSSLRSKIKEELGSSKLTRKDLWVKILTQNFMNFKSSDYRKEIEKLKSKNLIGFIDTRGTGRLNDDSVIYWNKN